MVVDEHDGGGNTQLMRVALDGHTEAVKDLLRKGASVNAQNHQGRTALMFAVINLRTDSVKALLKFGADVNVQAICGCTALMLAACSGDTEITRALLNSGADANKICRPGKTALVVAIEHGYHAIVDLLKRAIGQSARVKPERLPSEIPGRERAGVLSATNEWRHWET
jgi:ankyrin repeat protein